MDDGAARTAQGREGALDELRARLREDLDGDVGRDAPLLDDAAHEDVVGLGGGGEADLDLLEAHAHEGVEEARLALGPHGLDERLVAVAQVDAAPDGRSRDDGTRPTPVGETDRLEGTIFSARIDDHFAAPPVSARADALLSDCA